MGGVGEGTSVNSVLLSGHWDILCYTAFGDGNKTHNHIILKL